ncbi:ExbD/TolR family protein [Candidatus Symbiothrix dinenymphae]|uniref:ExbD/TolR family protein n=1 Tax=Candidatus Symbiothrix dinenymphae TaxID=467085 RepID=UPI0006BF5779|nr:biopolymer transporter ExbD [Candidatus Symbiothrix dinenymphae]GAP72235.1 ExbD [Candidatus Symbiothrix dinenymphae]
MGIKRKNKLTAEFNMSSMTDMIFLLLIFFMITSTVVTPNAIKVMLPQSAQQTSAKPLSRVTIDKNLRYYVAYDREKEKRVNFDDIVPFLQKCYAQNNEMYVALYADETIPYAEVVKLLDIANQNHFKMILVTRPH